MASLTHRRGPSGHHSRSSRRPVSRRTLVWLLALILVVLIAAAVPAALYARAQGWGAASQAPPTGVQVGTASRLPADRFVESILTSDGALGWRQLCPSVQAALPIDQLVQQANAARSAAAQQGIRLTAQFESTQSRQGGGEQRLYMVTAHWSNGTIQQRSLAVLTQPSGCVEDAGYQ